MEKTKDKKLSHWESFKKYFPWYDFFVGLVIPKLIYYLGIKYVNLAVGASVAFIWSFVIFLVEYNKTKKVSFFPTFSMILIIARTLSIIIKGNSNVGFVADAFDSFIIGLMFLLSLFLKKSLIEYFIGQGVFEDIPLWIRNSAYYSKAWKIITAVWGIINVVLGIVIILAYLRNYQNIASIVDYISGWPATLILIYFSILFPKIYWTDKCKKGLIKKI